MAKKVRVDQISLSTPIEKLWLPTLTVNALMMRGITDVASVISLTECEFERIKHIGKKGMAAI